jgi:hypothetical protein
MFPCLLVVKKIRGANVSTETFLFGQLEKMLIEQLFA